MNSVVLIVLIALVAFTAGKTVGADRATLKLLSFLKHSELTSADLELIERFFISCPESVDIMMECLDICNFNPNPIGDAEWCETARIEGYCTEKAFTAVPFCAGNREAIYAVRRIIQPYIERYCVSTGSVLL